MISATIRLTVHGDSYNEIATKALDLLNNFFGEEDISNRAIEISVEETPEDEESEFSYVGHVTAKARTID